MSTPIPEQQKPENQDPAVRHHVDQMTGQKWEWDEDGNPQPPKDDAPADLPTQDADAAAATDLRDRDDSDDAPRRGRPRKSAE